MRATSLVSAGYANLEFDLEIGRRARAVHAEALLQRITGAEAASVVNNNAAAVLLALTALAHRKVVVVARSQLVEIGGGFRVPDIMKQSGAPACLRLERPTGYTSQTWKMPWMQTPRFF